MYVYVATTEMHAKHANFVGIPQIKIQNNKGEFNSQNKIDKK